MPGMEYPYVGLPGIQPLMPGLIHHQTIIMVQVVVDGYSLQNSGNRPIGGGGRGGSPAPGPDQAAIDYLGGGGGNDYYTDFTALGGGGSGGSGIVVIRYPA